jgi:hypothetical protein
MGVSIRIAGTTVSERLYRFDQLDRLEIVCEAFDGNIGVGTFILPDPDGDTNFKGHREVYITQDDGAGAVVLFDGFIGDQGRTGIAPLHPEREHILQTADGNILMTQFRVHATRPEETIADRWRWFRDEYRVQWDDTWILDTDPVTLPAKNYGGLGFTELIADTVGCGKTAFVHSNRDPAAAFRRCLHMHRFTEGHTATISISDVTADWLGVADVFPPIKFELRQHSPIELYNDIVGRDQAGRSATVADAISIADHNADGMEHDAIVDFEANSQEELFRLTQQYLTEHKLEQQSYIVTISGLGADDMAKFNEGDLIDVTSEILGMPGTLSPIRIARYRATPTKDVNGKPMFGLWDVEMTLGSPIRATRRRLQRVIGPTVPFVPTDALPSVVQTGCGFALGGEVELTFPLPVTEGHMLVAWLVSRGSANDLNPPAGWTTIAEGDLDTGLTASPAAMYYKVATGTEAGETVFVFESTAGTSRPKSLGWELADVGTPTDFVSEFQPGNTANPFTTDALTVGPGIVIIGVGTGDDEPLTPDGASIEPSDNFYAELGDHFFQTALGADHITSAAGTQAYTAEWGTGAGFGNTHTVVAAFFPSSGTAPGPFPGQVTSEELTGDGTTVEFQTNYPYIPNSLHVTVDGIHTIVEETDPTTGTFTFTDPPDVDAQIIVTYQAATDVGTGATNPPPTPSTPPPAGVTDHGALTGLGDDDHDEYETVHSGGGPTRQDHGAVGTTETVDAANGNMHRLLLDDDCTITVSAFGNGGIVVKLTQDGTGGHAVTWSGPDFGGADDQPAQGAGDVTFYTIVSDGGNLYGFKAVGGSSVGALDDLSDVTLTSPATADRLRYDGSVWRNSALIWRPSMTFDGTNWLPLVDGDGNAVMTEA